MKYRVFDAFQPPADMPRNRSFRVLVIPIVGALFFLGSVLLFSAVGLASQAGDPRLSLYIVDPLSKRKILPMTSPSSLPIIKEAMKDNTIRVSACRGEFEPASIVLVSTERISGVTVYLTDLANQEGAVISRNALDVKVVKCWYQGTVSTVMNMIGSPVLVPELLLKDDSLVLVDEMTKKNYLRVKNNGTNEYVDVSSASAVFPSNGEIYDAQTLQPFDIEANRSKQLWLTIRVPYGATPGVYTGTISVRTGTQALAAANVHLTVLPFDLAAPALDYGIYYRGVLQPDVVTEIGSERKSIGQYTKELQDMKDHGVLYPTLYQPIDTMFGQALSIRQSIGLPVDKLYSAALLTGDLSTPDWLGRLSVKTKRWKAAVSAHGYGDLYAYGKDEAKGEALVSQRAAWYVVHQAGAKVFAACYADAVEKVGATLDVAVLNGRLNPEIAAKWHALGKKVFSYDNPQIGVEDPDVYRRNYGIMLLCSGYDGAMDYAYQHSYGHIWNDFDNIRYRDHVFAYPTSDGVIDTIEWEGFREGVDDVRYLSTLAKVVGPSAYPSVCRTVSETSDLNRVREGLINRIEGK